MLISFLQASEDEKVKRVYSHLLIHDHYGAQKECETALLSYPDSSRLKGAFVRALAENGKDDEAYRFWKKWKDELSGHDHNLLETISWGVLARTDNSSQLILNAASLMSAFFTQDVRAVKMLLRYLNSSNAYLRAMAVQLSAHYRDHILIQELKRMLTEERVWYVRLEVISALGKMNIKEIKEPLKKILASSRRTAEEKSTAISSLVAIYDEIDEKELQQLVNSKRAGLRYLACELIAHLDLIDKISTIETLLNDSIPDIRVAALNTLSLLGLKHLSRGTLNRIKEMMEDSHPPVSITAAYITSRFNPDEALPTFKKWIYSQDDASRRLAAAVLAKVGGYLVEEVLKLSPDPYVKANLALGMIGRGGRVDFSCDVLFTFLSLNQDKIMWDTSGNPLFQVIAPSLVRHIPQVSEYPTMVDQFTRLEILNTLAILKYPNAEEAVKSFLTHQTLGVTYTASNTLLEEGGEDSLEILRGLLKQPDENIRIQAALVLALSGGETEAIQVLQDAYKEVGREMKTNILGALGHIGNQVSIPFLITLLEEPYQTLRVVAASSLIQCLYH